MNNYNPASAHCEELTPEEVQHLVFRPLTNIMDAIEEALKGL